MSKAVLRRLAASASRLLVPFFATAIGLTSVARAESAEASAPAVLATPQSCQEQFLLGRKENAQLALQRLRQCNAIYNTSTNIEEFTFWYVTLPSKPASQHNAWFGNIWRNNLQILTAAPVGIPKQEAIGVLDAGIARGLKRARREDLGPKWLASHDPAIMTEAALPDVPAPTEHERAQQSNAAIAQPPQAGQPASVKMVAEQPRVGFAARAAAYRAVSRPRRVTRRLHARYAGRDRIRPEPYDGPQPDPVIEEYRVQPPDAPPYASSGAPYGALPSQAYTVPGGQPASSFASAAAQRSAEPSSLQRQPAWAAPASGQRIYAPAQPQASYATSPQPAAYLPLPLQIEANLRSALHQFAINVNTLEQAISRQLRGY